MGRSVYFSAIYIELQIYNKFLYRPNVFVNFYKLVCFLGFRAGVSSLIFDVDCEYSAEIFYTCGVNNFCFWGIA